jgi:predicted N-formylglutamate amidohydrolase
MDRKDRHLEDEACADSLPRSKGLLGRDDPSPAIVSNKSGSSPFLLLGDHAGRIIPEKLGTLGLPPEAFEQHIAWDIGIAGLGERLSKALDATFIRQPFSRLVVDCNRKHTAPDFVPTVSDGVTIPGNVDLKTSDRSARRREIHMAYHHRITGLLEARDQQARDTVLVSLHSFTPSLNGEARPWKYGVLHRGDSKISSAMLALLRERFGDEAGDNQPYAMDGIDYTIPFHADPRGLPYLELEIRQDLIADGAGQDEVAALLAELLGRLA